MGLDTQAIRGLIKVESPSEEELDNGELHSFYVMGIWPRTEAGVPRGYYKEKESIAGPSSSYGGHSVFREQLAAMFGKTPEEVWEGSSPDIPFYELIHFSDCGGAIGNPACKKLATDFRRHLEAFEMAYSDVSTRKYKQWMELFEWAAEAEDGLVTFF